MYSVIRPKGTTSRGWNYLGKADAAITCGYAGQLWEMSQRRLFVISALEAIDGPHYHLSASKNGGRCSRQEVKYILRCFGMTDAEEDNHVPHGIARNFFLPVDENKIGRECSCKTTEPAVVEDKGEYVWRGVD